MRALFLRTAATLAALGAVLAFAPSAHADDPAPSTWGTAAVETRDAYVSSPPTRARMLLARARELDETAVSEERAAKDAAARLPKLRADAAIARKVAKDTQDRTLVARADDLEAELAVTESEIAFRNRLATEDRATARDLRARAVKVMREALEAPISEMASLTCDPPFYYSAQGRKTYRVECFR